MVMVFSLTESRVDILFAVHVWYRRDERTGEMHCGRRVLLATAQASTLARLQARIVDRRRVEVADLFGGRVLVRLLHRLCRLHFARQGIVHNAYSSRVEAHVFAYVNVCRCAIVRHAAVNAIECVIIDRWFGEVLRWNCVILRHVSVRLVQLRL